MSLEKEKRKISLPENIRGALEAVCATAGVAPDVIAYICLRDPFEYTRSQYPDLPTAKLRKAVDAFEPGRLRKESTPQFGMLLKLYADLSTHHQLGELPIALHAEKIILKQLDHLLNISAIRAEILGEIPNDSSISSMARQGLTGALSGYIKDIASGHQPTPATAEELKKAILANARLGGRAGTPGNNNS
ncbi:MAG: hypothetical protein HYV32_05640 [Candidatus Kerfeldbacteria bacterium]|nr:hypothetical protein [Candidatus Kerfeldbacteria bacterium]